MLTRSEIGLAELVLAYELRAEGCCWKRIAQGLGCDERALACKVAHMCDVGIRPQQGPMFSPELMRSAGTMRAQGFGWTSIATHLCVDRDQLQRAWWTYRSRYGETLCPTSATR